MDNNKEKESATDSSSIIPQGDFTSKNIVQQSLQAVNQPSAQHTQPKPRAKKKLVVIADVEKVLANMQITVRFNIISGQLEIIGMPNIYSAENAVNVLPILIKDHFRLNGMTVSVQDITDALTVIADKNRYNPVIVMLNSVQYDGLDYLDVLDQILGICDNPQARKLLRKWMHQTISLALNNENDPFGADGVLVLQGDQGEGKTLFFRILSVFSRLFAEGVSIDADSKDSIIQSTAVWISELGELDSTLKREQPRLKAFLTSSQDTYRPPYARAAIRRTRRTSFCGTVNPAEFLNDDTGSRRYWVIHIDHIDTKTLLSLTPEWLKHMWLQVYEELYKPNPQGFRLTPDERMELLSNNQSYEKKMPGEIEIMDHLNFDLDDKNWFFYSTSDVMALLNIRGVSSSQVGKVLSKIAKNNSKVEIKKSHNVTQYKLPQLPNMRDW